MPTHDDPRNEPLVEPRVIKRLKDRPRIVDWGVRKQFLEQLEKVAIERRKPGNVARGAVRTGFDRFQEAGEDVAKETTEEVLEKGNNSIFKRL